MSAGNSDVQATALPATAQGSAHPGAILITEYMWVPWANLAIEHLHESTKARADLVATTSAGDPRSQADALARETAKGVETICAAAFAMDALLIAWARLVMPPATVTTWESPGRTASATARAREVLKRSVGSAAEAQSLTDRWDVIFNKRGGAVHFGETPEPPIPHPSGIGNVSPVHLTYDMERATEAADLLLSTLKQSDWHASPPWQPGSMARTPPSLPCRQRGDTAKPPPDAREPGP
jgi:hypothetical protein